MSKQCSVEGCLKPAIARGLCTAHYHKFNKTGTLFAFVVVRTKNVGQRCSVEGCSTVSKIKGFCNAHYKRFRKYGDATVVKVARKGSKVCTRGHDLTLPNSLRPMGGYSTCRKCLNKMAYDRYHRDIEKTRESRRKMPCYNKTCDPSVTRKQRHEMTSQEFEGKIHSQGGRCVCGRFFSLKIKPCVDHEHFCCDGKKNKKTCGKCNRGILCNRCNLVLGLFERIGDIDLLPDYLKKYLDYWNRKFFNLGQSEQKSNVIPFQKAG